MRVLLVKTSSLGDLVHSLPALTDAAQALPGIQFDWVAEEGFADLPSWHPAVAEVIPIALRRWRRDWRRAWRRGEIRAFLAHLRARSYDRVIDAQGLLFKSAWVAALARGPSAGYDRHSARDPWVSWTYQRRHQVAKNLHAIERVRRLFAAELGYPVPAGPPDYGIRRPPPLDPPERPYVILLHGTTWPSKRWPDIYWAELTQRLDQAGLRACFPWDSPDDRLQAERVLRWAEAGELLERDSLAGLARRLAGASAVVGVDTGLIHLAAAFGVPSVSLYGPTRVDRTGALGPAQRNLEAQFPCAPCLRRDCHFDGDSQVLPACFGALPPEQVWEELSQLLGGTWP